jgi:choline dehydrogenase-like flavoprotein
MNRAVYAHGQHIAAQLALTPQAMQRERVLNARVCFCSVFPGEGSEGAKALFRVKQALLNKDQPGHTLSGDALMMMRDPVNTFLYGFTRLVHPRFLIRHVGFQLIVEPLPNPDSRVSLSLTERDALGMPRVEVCWKLDPLVKRTADKTLALISQTLRKGAIAKVSELPEIEKNGWPASFEPEGTWHHMGTTRMHDDERKGVVNRDSRVHGYGNFYIAGSSVFPTAGANFPTITITALALRLANHLVAELNKSSSVPIDAIDSSTTDHLLENAVLRM